MREANVVVLTRHRSESHSIGFHRGFSLCFQGCAVQIHHCRKAEARQESHGMNDKWPDEDKDNFLFVRLIIDDFKGQTAGHIALVPLDGLEQYQTTNEERDISKLNF